ncbi:hypothetical protein T552_02955 [Pneumocystis carinii B80]|uniref:Karyogamy protein n=1 Tax=Pneumocystis carinii (strain B80) TaxID=1408658 RepID=A0A0W4ZDR6_PNEC8|nr:hypothetical protein T552_02955 [Pneumocystis carinii B80]KTW26474.1 hypothetical protein T552_02955 [Pneumocystis carinii B80]
MDKSLDVFEEIDGIEEKKGVDEGFSYLNKLMGVGFVDFLQKSTFQEQLSQLTSLLSVPRMRLFEKEDIEAGEEYFCIFMDMSVYMLSWIELAIYIFKYFDMEDDIEWVNQAKGLFNELEQEIRDSSPVFDKFIKDSFSPAFLNLSNFDILSFNAKCQEVYQGWIFIKKLLSFIKSRIEISKEWVDCIEILNQINQELKKCEVLVFEIKERCNYIPFVSDRFVEISTLESFVKDVFDGEKVGILEQINSSDVLNKWNMNCQNFICQVHEKVKPLETSLIFFKLRIEYFKEKATELFPSAIHNIEQKRLNLEIKCNKLQDEFFYVKKRFQEDKWLFVFSQVNKQATQIMDSLELEIKKFNVLSPLTKKASEFYKTYKIKKDSYVIIRIITLMEWGIWNKLTSDSHVIEGYNVLYERWKNLNKDIIKIDNIILKDDSTFEIAEDNSQYVSHDSESEASQSTKSCIMTPKTPKSPKYLAKQYSLIPVFKTTRRSSLSSTLKTGSENCYTPKILRHSSVPFKGSKMFSFVEETPSLRLSKIKLSPPIMEKAEANNSPAYQLIPKSMPIKNSYSGTKTRDLESNIPRSCDSIRRMASTGGISYKIPDMKYKENISFSSIPRPSFRRMTCLPILESKDPMKTIPSQKTFMTRTSIPLIRKRECIFGTT